MRYGSAAVMGDNGCRPAEEVSCMRRDVHHDRPWLLVSLIPEHKREVVRQGAGERGFASFA